MASINTLAEVQANSISQNEYWSHRLLEMIKLEKSNFVFSNLGKAISLPKRQGTKKISVRRYNSLPVSADLTDEVLAEGIAPTPLIGEAQRVDAVINQYGAYMKETDWVDEIHFDDIKSVYQPELARHAAEVIERQIMSSFTDASEYFVGVYNATGSDVDLPVTAIDKYILSNQGENVLTLQDVRKVAITMKNYRRAGHSKFGGKPVLVCHTNVMNDLLDDAVLINKMLVPGNDNTPIKNGTLQKFLVFGIYFVETLIADITENTPSGSFNSGTATLGSAANVYTSYLLGRDPYVVVSLGKGGLQWKMTGFGAEKTDPLGQIATFGYKMWTGSKIIDPIAITRIYSQSAYDIAAPDFSSDAYGATADQTVN